jgi:GT2 family glycosyltransferase
LKTVYFICVNFNNSHFTKLALTSLDVNARTSKACRIVTVVVDNASNDADFAKLKTVCEQHENVVLIRSDKNTGYFGGLNIGLNSIDRKPGDLVMIGNNDLTFPPGFIDTLVGSVYPDDVYVVAPNVITADGYHQNPHCPQRVSKARKFLYRLYFSHYWLGALMGFVSAQLKELRGGRVNTLAGTSRYIHMGIGACYILTERYFQHFTRLDDAVFLYGEEALLAGQVMSAGGKTYYDAALIVHHAESATLSKLPSRTTYEFARASYPKYRQFL